MNAEDIRDRILANLRKGSAATMEAGWDLAGFGAENVFSQLTNPQTGQPYTTFKQWWRAELSHAMALNEVVDLINLAVTFYPIRPTIDAALREGRKTMRWLRKARSLLRDAHTTLDEIERCLNGNLKLAAEMVKAPTRRPQRITVDVGHEHATIMPRLIRFAIAHGFPTINDAMVGILRGIEGDLPPAYRPFKELVDSGSFSCAVCQKIPNPPATIHHPHKRIDIPVCAEPCRAIHEKRLAGRLARKAQLLAKTQKVA